MRKLTLFPIALGFVLASACAKSGSADVKVSPTKRDTSDSTIGSLVCPYVETEGRYELLSDHLKCTLSGRPAAPDFSFVPVLYEVRSHIDGTGSIELLFHHGRSGRDVRVALKFPRSPTSSDISYKGIQCSTGVQDGHNVKSLSHPCPGAPSFCTYTFTQSDDDYLIEMSRIQNDQTYTCHGKLEKL